MRAAASIVLLSSTALSAAKQVIDWRMGWDNEEMQNLKAAPGDILRFEWDISTDGIPHNVVLLNQCNLSSKQKWDNFQCGNVANIIPNGKGELLNTVDEGEGKRSVEYKIPDNAKSACFVCTISNHCTMGQHSSVKVIAPTVTVHDANVWVIGMPESLRALEVAEGDKIRFSWKGSHNVWLMDSCPDTASATSFDCDGEGKELAGIGSSPYVYDVTEKAGERLCFYCQVNSHCYANQYLVVDVVEELDVDRNAVLTKCKKPNDEENHDDICKACGGKRKDAEKCKIKGHKFNTMTCSRIRKNKKFCESVGCVAVGDSCAGTLGKGL